MTRVRKIRKPYSPRLSDLAKPCKQINREREQYRLRYKFHMTNHQDTPDLRRCSICQKAKRYADSRAGYYKEVWRLTEIAYRDHYQTINPTKIHRGTLFQLDHIYSINQGFENRIPAKIIASHHNLRLLEKRLNLSKGDRCDITISELKKRIKNSGVK